MFCCFSSLEFLGSSSRHPGASDPLPSHGCNSYRWCPHPWNSSDLLKKTRSKNGPTDPWNIHPGRLTWNIQITHLERKMIFQTPMIMFHVNLPGCTPDPKPTVYQRIHFIWRFGDVRCIFKGMLGFPLKHIVSRVQTKLPVLRINSSHLS